MDDLKGRKNKGRSIIKKVSDYTLIDIETTGLNPGIDEIIEVAALKVRNNEIIDKYQSFIKPRLPIPEYITKINGITDDMVKDSDPIEYVLPRFLDFIDSDILLGFYTVFDVNFLYDEADKIYMAVENDYVDVRRIAKIILPDFKKETGRNYKLSNLVRFFKLGKQEHRALSDCLYTKQLYDKLNEISESQSINYEDIYKTSIRHNELKAKDIIRENTDTTLFTEEKFVFTGKLNYMTRRKAMQLVVNYGGTVGDTLSKDTDYLVMGTQDYSKLNGKKSKKQEKAEQLNADGEDISIITEDVFYNMIGFTPQEIEEEENEDPLAIEISIRNVILNDEDMLAKIRRISELSGKTEEEVIDEIIAQTEKDLAQD